MTEPQDLDQLFEEILGVSDELYAKSVTAVTLMGRASPDILNQIFNIGIARACRIMDLLESDAVVGTGETFEVRPVNLRSN